MQSEDLSLDQLTVCPGCGRRLEFPVCCAQCWQSAPSRLGQWHNWRDLVQTARVAGDGDTARAIYGELVAWLREHPREV